MRVCHLIKTTALKSDGRLQKWIKSLKVKGYHSDILILQDNNSDSYEEGPYNSAVNKIALQSRRLFKQRKGYFFKVPEYAIKTFFFLRKQKNTDVFVFHDVQQYLNLFIATIFFRNKQIIWDLHELPHNVMFRHSLFRSFLKYLLKNVDVVIYTNQERRDYIIDKLNVQEKAYTILNNFPDLDYINKNKTPLPTELKSLRPDLPYIIWLGAATAGRNFDTFLKTYDTVLSSRFNLVILGRIDSEFRLILNKYIDVKYCYNAFIPQQKMINYIDNAYFSVVLYNCQNPNNLYCEPNRLYQLITRHIPCVVGHNPTMSNIINKTGGAVVLSDDGSEVQYLSQSINELLTSLNDFKTRLETNSIIEKLNWDDQFDNDVAPLVRGHFKSKLKVDTI
ncbi:hypothetical protein [Parapedobacter soli]|uniref:hypothetical protein n=1 Tax=Parapedobacter soli TaxID=416955 RepID=UPI0021CA66C4|nr:hypothetical protein [Parapedobacter soli]